MYELDNPMNTPPQYIQPQEDFSPIKVLVITLFSVCVGIAISTAATLGLAAVYGLDFNDTLQRLNESQPVGSADLMRYTLFLQHLFMFILAAIGTAYFCYKSKWLKMLQISTVPTARALVLGVILLIFVVPSVEFTAFINKMIPLPSWAKGMEEQTSAILDLILTVDAGWKIWLNLFIIAIMPAIGEELIFRGLVQRQIERLVKHEHLSVWIAGAIFSAIHFQFEGFLPRMLLGAMLGYLYIWTRNLWVPIFVHFINNALQLAAIYMLDKTPKEIEQMTNNATNWWGLILMLVATLPAVFIIARYIKLAESPPPPPTINRDDF